jgi:hypothetical protein
MKAD